jgi:hypothetical protein
VHNLERYEVDRRVDNMAVTVVVDKEDWIRS